MTEFEWNIYKETADFLDLFGCDCGIIGYYYFVEMVYIIRAKWREKGEKYLVLGKIVGDLCKNHNTFPRAVWSQIRAAVLPVLSADDCVLQAYGITLKKRTSSELAYALADFFENR